MRLTDDELNIISSILLDRSGRKIDKMELEREKLGLVEWMRTRGEDYTTEKTKLEVCGRVIALLNSHRYTDAICGITDMITEIVAFPSRHNSTNEMTNIIERWKYRAKMELLSPDCSFNLHALLKFLEGRIKDDNVKLPVTVIGI